MIKIIRFLSLVLSIGISQVYAQDGTIDEFFKVTSGFEIKQNSVTVIDIQSDGKILVGGNFSAYNGIPVSNFTRLNQDGTLDTDFKTGKGFDNEIYSIKSLNDGSMFVGGVFTSYNGRKVPPFVHLQANGELDTTYTHEVNHAPLPYNITYAILPLPDGKLMLGTSYGIFRYMPDGSKDKTFIFRTELEVTNLVMQPDGKILVGGMFGTIYTPDTKNLGGVVRITQDGNFDPTFRPRFLHFSSESETHALVYTKDNKIIIGGLFDNYDGKRAWNLVRVYPNGDLDSTFLPKFDNRVSSIIEQPDGKIIITGWFNSIYDSDYPAIGIVRLNQDGSIDKSFVTGMGFDNHVRRYNAVQQKDGKILIGGKFSHYNGTFSRGIVRLNNFSSYCSTLDYSQSVQSGNWDDEKTWACGIIPSLTKNIFIGKQHVIKSLGQFKDKNVVLNGELQVFPGITLESPKK